MRPELASLRGRIGAFRLHALYDPAETTAKARSTFLARFEEEVDPERVLPPAERERRALYARKAYFARLAFKSAQSRGARSKRKAVHPLEVTDQQPSAPGPSRATGCGGADQ